MKIRNVRTLALASAISLALGLPASAAPVPNALRFSVGVSNNGSPFNGTVDLQLQFFDAPTGGAPLAGPLIIEDVPVSGGVGFFVADFGATNPLGNQETWIGGGLRTGSSTGAFQVFTTRGRFVPGGYSLHAQKIAPGIVGDAEIVPSQVQSRVDASCGFGLAIRSIAEDGSVACEPVTGGGAGSITGVNAGAGLAGGGGSGSVTLSIAPLGVVSSMIADGAVATPKLAAGAVDASRIASGAVGAAQLAANAVDGSRIADGSVAAADINPAQVQRRIGSACASGQAIRAVNADGTVACEPGGSNAWGLFGNTVTGGPFLGTINDQPLELRAANRSALRLRSLNDPDGIGYGGGIATVAATLGDGSNEASGPGSSVLGGGNAESSVTANLAQGRYSTVLGGLGNRAGGDFSLAAGHLAVVRNAAASGDANGDEGSMVFADAQLSTFSSSGPNQFAVRAGGGVFIGAGGPASVPAGRFINTSTGAHLTSGGTWTNASSRVLKTAFEAVDVDAVLARVLALPITRWQYRGGAGEGAHLGPVAEDFHAAFGLGADGTGISTVDADGVALAAIQGLHGRLRAEHAALAADNAALRAELAALRSAVTRLLEEADAAAPDGARPTAADGKTP